jgi:hypothetical protein
LIFDLLLKEYIIGGSSLEGMSEVLGYDDVHNIDKLDIDAILIESTIEVIHQSSSELALNITNLASLDASNVVTYGLFTLLSEELLELVGSQVVKEFFTILLSGGICTNVEGHTDINRDLHVVFSWAALNLYLTSIIHVLYLTSAEIDQRIAVKLTGVLN